MNSIEDTHRSADDQGQPDWRRSSRCSNSACLEVASAGQRILVRDSKHPNLTVECTRADWSAFLAGIKAGEYDDL